MDGSGDLPAWEQQTLTRIILRAQDGSLQSQDELFTQLQDYLTFIAREHFQADGKAGVSDVVQQSMIQAVENIDKFRGGSAAEFRGWLRQIVVNEARQTRRKFAADKRDARRERQMEGPAGDSKQHFDFADSLPTPGTNAMAMEDAKAIEAAMARLPENYREVIRLRNWEKLSFGQIAKHMNVTSGAAAKLWYRALVELQKQYGAFDE